jgi:hypothetical protein
VGSFRSISCLCVFSSELWCPLRFLCRNDVRYEFFSISFCRVSCTFIFYFYFLFYIYWCLTRLLYQMFASLSNNNIDTRRTGTAYPSRVPDLIRGFCGFGAFWSLVFCVMNCRPLFVIVLFLCIVYLSLIYGFWLFLWYPQTVLTMSV